MSRKEARIERENLKRLRDEEKSARLRGRQAEEKVVRTGVDPASAFHMTMTWSRAHSDCEGEWSWGQSRQWSDADWRETIEPKLRVFSTLTWKEIDTHSSDTGHKMHHNMDTESICDEAQYRMVEIDRYEDVIFRFRLGNKRRLWGHRVVANFEILWYDPEHKIYPTEPD